MPACSKSTACKVILKDEAMFHNLWIKNSNTTSLTVRSALRGSAEPHVCSVTPNVILKTTLFIRLSFQTFIFACGPRSDLDYSVICEIMQKRWCSPCFTSTMREKKLYRWFIAFYSFPLKDFTAWAHMVCWIFELFSALKLNKTNQTHCKTSSRPSIYSAVTWPQFPHI